MDILIVLGAGYLATWIMLFSRTYGVCKRMILVRQPKNLIAKYEILHIIIFALGIGFLTIPLFRAAFDNTVRKAFCIGYVRTITEKE